MRRMLPGRRARTASRLASAAGILALAAGCATIDPVGTLTPGMTQDRVREAMGRPDATYALPGGGTLWQYPKGPYGQVTWMATFGSDGRLQRVEQALTDERFARIVPGMSKADIERLYGRPYEKVAYPNLGQEIWDWRYQESGIWDMRFNVHFDLKTGLVVTTTRSLEQRGGAPSDVGSGRSR